MDWLTRSPMPLVVCAAMYVAMGVGFWNYGQRGLAVTHWAYALGNVGLIVAWYEVT